MNVEDFGEAKPIINEIERIDAEIKRLPMGTHPRNLIMFDNPLEKKTFDKHFYVMTHYSDRGSIRLNHADLEMLIYLRKKRRRELVAVLAAIGVKS